MLGSHSTGGRIDRTGPRCPYRHVAKYRGAGQHRRRGKFCVVLIEGREDATLFMARKFGTLCAVLAMIVSGAASAQELPRGEIVDDVQCQRDASQRYALYLPSYFNPSRPWPVILTFDGSGRGREGVERYRAAAEKYGYVVAGSNNSRNGPWNVGLDAAAAMTADIKGRFPIDRKRMYTAGMSGGARVAIMVAQNSPAIAGVLASSAGYSTAFHKSERFPFFGTAGTEDFNYREMRVVDRLMTSPHRVEVFEGGHTWPPVEMATSGVEWMEIQAMKNGLTPARRNARRRALLETRGARRRAADNLSRMRELKQIAADFETLRDVARVIESAAALERGKDVAGALSAEQADDARELRVKSEVERLVRQLGWPESADAALVSLKSFVASLLDIARQAGGLVGTPHRAARAGRSARVEEWRPQPEFSGVDRTEVSFRRAACSAANGLLRPPRLFSGSFVRALRNLWGLDSCATLCWDEQAHL